MYMAECLLACVLVCLSVCHTCVCVYVCVRYLAHMYMAECLVALDCIADGIDHLNPDLVTDVGTVFLSDHKAADQGQSSSSSFLRRPVVVSYHIIVRASLHCLCH